MANSSALAFLDQHHPLGAGSPAITLALGIFWQGKVEGVMTFGNPTANNAVTRYGLRQHQALELRKMWCSDVLPNMAEGRALAVAAMLIRKHYPNCQMILTYCDGEEAASAYKGAGWLAQDAHRYPREVFVKGVWYSIRNANRLGIKKQATDHKWEHRRKWILPLHADVAQRLEHLASSQKDGGSNPTHPLSAPASTHQTSPDAPTPQTA